MASIDKISVNGTPYTINLPTTATPSIAGLTVSTLTVGGDAAVGGILSTAAAATISKELTVGGQCYHFRNTQHYKCNNIK